MQEILAIDAGGTGTRAVIADLDGHCRGFGTAGAGNPISAGFDGALDAYATATRMALGTQRETTDAQPYSSILIAMAGKSARLPMPRIASRLEAIGVSGPIELESDLLAMFCSGTPSPNGYALAAGTGAVAARVSDHRLDIVCGGTGWLLGDGGSGYWIGHQVVRAVVAALDGLGVQTALTAKLLSELDLTRGPERVEGRPAVLLKLIEALYEVRPVELSRFAPLAFDAHDDHVASAILAAAASELVAMLDAVQSPRVAGPLVLGGSVLLNGMLGEAGPLTALLNARTDDAEVRPVRDGVVGAVVLALLKAGVRVDKTIFERIEADVTRLRARTEPEGAQPA